MTQCSLLMYPGLLPAYLILQLRLWFYFYNYSDLPLPNQYLIWPPLLLTTYLDKASLEKVFFFFLFASSGLIWSKFLLRSSFWQTRTSSRKLEAKLDRALGAAAGPAVQRFSTGPLPLKLNYSAQPSLVQHSCWSNIFGNSHYFRNECSCVFLANHMPALSTIKEIRIQQTSSSN